MKSCSFGSKYLQKSNNRIQLGTSSGMRRKSFQNGKNTVLLCLLNLIRTTPTNTCATIDFGKEELFTLTEVAAAMRELNCRKHAGKDEIRPEMLKALNGERGGNLEKHQNTGRQV